jgi:hypothetical protein
MAGFQVRFGFAVQWPHISTRKRCWALPGVRLCLATLLLGVTLCQSRPLHQGSLQAGNSTRTRVFPPGTMVWIGVVKELL